MSSEDPNPATPAIADRLATISERIHAACRRSGRDPESVTLVGVSKRQPIDRMRAAYAAGLRTFGENQVQEGVAKCSELPTDIDWHFIGHLQSNKAKAAARHFGTIHSIDRVKIAQRLDREAALLGRTLKIFVQINIGREPSKSGFEPEGFVEAVAPLATLEHLAPLGLMALPPYEDDPEKARDWFRRLRELRDLLLEQPAWARCPGLLSMGMSHDFELAIEEGATHVRVGTSIFGRRPS